MKKRVKQAARVILGRAAAGRSLTVFPDDIFIVSYPKSGSTWTRFLVANLVSQDEPITFANIERKVPDIYRKNDRALLQSPRPRILRSHEYFDPRYKKVIYIVRDPRDVVVSYYYYHIKTRAINDGYPLDQYVQEFVSGELGRYGAWGENYGTWGENVGSWLGARECDPNFLLLRYEDMQEDPMHELKKVAIFLSHGISKATIENAIANSSFECMQQLEKKEVTKWIVTRKSRKDIAFVRKGKSGGWRVELTEANAKKIKQAWAHLMDRFGYL